MLGNFKYHNPTKLYFGEESLKYLERELANFGDNVQLVYGGGSIKKNGIYDQIVEILKKCNKNIIEDPGVMPNPTVNKLREGVDIARKNGTDFILAVGGGSCCDYAKAVSVSIHCDEDPWDKYYLRFEEPTCEILPVGCILTMAGTGSEMNAGAVITNHEQKLKIGHVYGPEVMPKFTILDPELTFTVPDYQVRAGIYDAFNHICEQYFSGEDDNTSDYLAEGLMRSLVHASRIAVVDPTNYEARSNISWVCTWALNTLISRGKSTDWEVHMIGQAIGAVTNATHGMTLSAVSLPYYSHILPYGQAKFARFATNVWGISAEGKTERELAEAGLAAMSSWMDEIGVVKHASELGLTPEMYDDVVAGTFLLTGGYHTLTPDEVRQILVESE